MEKRVPPCRNTSVGLLARIRTDPEVASTSIRMSRMADSVLAYLVAFTSTEFCSQPISSMEPLNVSTVTDPAVSG